MFFKDILYSNNYKKNFAPLRIKSNLEFIPSIPEISDQYLTEINHDINWGTQLDDFFSLVEQKYDVILFDCQAGYTELLPALLPLMDIDLVGEISGTSIRYHL